MLSLTFKQGQTHIVLNNEDNTYDESRQWCHDNHMDMIMIKTKSDYDEVNNTLTSESTDTSFQFWIGLKWDTDRDRFYWRDNTVLTWANWCTGGTEPGGMSSSSGEYNSGENCVRLDHRQDQSWCFATKRCNTVYKTMCVGCK
ncbi:Hypothetical predicted protein [Mytilus galloprovincialis]|uniref:C-type lectin domain-containing protein n=1 Tax=Mytilus galloprovincialis TaxID=29158 RepID=A0A8B6GQV3_MYTGA|nr:Hypothetical predicted protein [Mytilus galloprovincialis]